MTRPEQHGRERPLSHQERLSLGGWFILAPLQSAPEAETDKFTGHRHLEAAERQLAVTIGRPDRFSLGTLPAPLTAARLAWPPHDTLR